MQLTAAFLPTGCDGNTDWTEGDGRQTETHTAGEAGTSETFVYGLHSVLRNPVTLWMF